MTEISDKVLNYEKFLNEKLRSDLKIVLQERDKIYGEIAEFLQVKSTIEKVLESGEPDGKLKTKVDLGCNFYVNAVIDDCSKIYISIGYGFFLEMTLPEALNFIEKKTKVLQEHADELTKQSSTIKAHIRLVLEGIKEIQNINFVEEKKIIDL